ncbi:MAG TPA: cytochrome c [Thermoanaerobaculia bacterium]|nr:cytochrome c [Thermoanaerobaculia bacterium]
MHFTIPTPLKIGLVVLGTTALYTYIGQLVPQKEVLPPAETVISSEMTTEQLVEVGRQVAENQGICLTCHTIGQSGSALRYPDLAGIGSRAETRVPGLGGVEYLAQSLYEPEAFIVPGFAGGMPPIHRPPIGLSDDEIKAVIAWLQSMGGTPTVTLQTDLGYGG